MITERETEREIGEGEREREEPEGLPPALDELEEPAMAMVAGDGRMAAGWRCFPSLSGFLDR